MTTTERDATPTYPRWEYKVLMAGAFLPHTDRAEAQMNQLGAVGWELVFVADAFMFFKRPLPNWRE